MDLNLLKKTEQDITNEHYLYRIGKLIEDGKLPHWKYITDEINKQLGNDKNNYLGESALRKPFQYTQRFVNAGVFTNLDSVEQLKQIEEKITELKKERYKIQTEKVEQNRWLRETARDELIEEKIINAINKHYTFEVPLPRLVTQQKKAYALFFGDEHYGKIIDIKDFFGETLNEYSPEIFETRMWDMQNQVIEIVNKEKIEVLNIYDLGDSCESILRVSQLMKLRYGVIDSVVRYSEFLSFWLNELSRYVNIKFHNVGGNHDELRLIGEKKGTFENENIVKVINAILKARLQNNPNIQLFNNDSNMIYDKLAGYGIVCFHGETKSMISTIKDLSYIYNKKINYLIGGHLHHSKEEEVGIDCEVINIPSIVGIDDYSLKLRKTSSAGAKLIVFEEDKGKSIEYNIKLN